LPGAAVDGEDDALPDGGASTRDGGNTSTLERPGGVALAGSGPLGVGDRAGLPGGDGDGAADDAAEGEDDEAPDDPEEPDCATAPVAVAPTARRKAITVRMRPRYWSRVYEGQRPERGIVPALAERVIDRAGEAQASPPTDRYGIKRTRLHRTHCCRESVANSVCGDTGG
jgi:hypothetical protein